MWPARSASIRPARGVLATVAAATLLWTAVLAYVAVAEYGGDLRGFTLPGERIRHPPAYHGAPAAPGPRGYDGQFYGALATDPLLLDARTPAFLDNPVYRATRVGIPLLAWGLSAGDGPRAIVLYTALCWALGVVGVAVVAAWLAREGRSPWWALLAATAGGVVASMLRALPDAAAASLVVLALWLERQDRRGAPLVLAAACLVRETSAIAVAGIALSHLLARPPRLGLAGTTVLVPAAAVLAWRSWLWVRLGRPLELLGGETFGAPVLDLVRHLLAAPSFTEAAGLLAIPVAGIAVVALAARWRKPEAVTLAGFVLLAVSLGAPVLVESWAHARAAVVLPFVATAAAAGETSVVRRALLLAVPALAALNGVGLLAGAIFGVTP